MNRLKFQTRNIVTRYPGSEEYLSKEHWEPVRRGQDEEWLDAIQREVKDFEKYNMTYYARINSVQKFQESGLYTKE